MCAGLFSLFFVASGSEFSFFLSGCRFLFGSWGLWFSRALRDRTGSQLLSPGVQGPDFTEGFIFPICFLAQHRNPLALVSFVYRFIGCPIWSPHLLLFPSVSVPCCLSSVFCVILILPASSPGSPGQARLKLSSHFLTTQCSARSEFLRPASFTCGAWRWSLISFFWLAASAPLEILPPYSGIVQQSALFVLGRLFRRSSWAAEYLCWFLDDCPSISPWLTIDSCSRLLQISRDRCLFSPPARAVTSPQVSFEFSGFDLFLQALVCGLL
jgi:hypothetical protein